MRKLIGLFLCLMMVSSVSQGAVKKSPRIFSDSIKKAEPKAEFIKKLNISGSLRLRYTASQLNAVSDAFSVSRGRIKISGEIAPDFLFLIQPDFAGLSSGGTVSLADIYGEFKFACCNLRFGQFLVPFGYDSAKYKTIFSTGFNPTYYGLIVPSRDYGMRMLGEVSNMPGLFFDAALINGTGGADVNKSKDLAARINYKNDFVDVGLSGYYGWAGAAQTAKKDAGIDIEYKMNPVQIVAEYMTGQNLLATAKMQDAYVQLSGLFDCHEPLIKYESYDPDVAAGSNIVNTLTLGYNCLINKSTKFLVNYNIINEETVQIDNNTLLFELQTQI